MENHPKLERLRMKLHGTISHLELPHLHSTIPRLFRLECLNGSRKEQNITEIKHLRHFFGSSRDSFKLDCLDGSNKESFSEQTISFSMVRHPFEGGAVTLKKYSG